MIKNKDGSITVCLAQNYMIRNLHSLITSCETRNQVTTLISLIDYIATKNPKVPMKSIEALLKEDK